VIDKDAAAAWMTSAQIRARFGVTSMTVHRWLRDERLQFPKPIKIRDRNYWRAVEICEFEKRMLAVGIAGQGPHASIRRVHNTAHTETSTGA
jgi:predicted DNA-binding transcriptional regulator AlpA